MVLAAAMLSMASVATTPTGSMAANWASEPSAASAVPTPTAAVPSPQATPSSGSGYPYSGPGDFVLADPRVGLDSLPSYRATLVVSFDGTEAGGPRRWTSTSELLRSSDPELTQVTVEQSGALPPAQPAFAAEDGALTYIVEDDLGCIASPVDPEAALRARSEPARELAGVIGAEEAGHQTVSGVQADGYSFDERALGLAGVADADGQVWIASDGGFVVRYSLSIKGDAGFFGGTTSGTQTWDYQLADIGVPVAIRLPADCPPGPIDAPTMSDASEIVDGPGVLTYRTGASLKDVVAFYQTEARKGGWDRVTEPAFTESAALIEYTLAGIRHTIFVRRSGAGSTVLIAVDQSR